MMSLDQAIAQYEQFANVCEHHGLTASQEEFEQLVAWLRELQERRKQSEIIKCKDCAYYDWDCVDVPYGMTKMICWCDLHYDAGKRESGGKSRRFLQLCGKENRQMMKWEAESKGYSCNDCYLSMQNCHDKSICCEDETGLCDYFEEIPTEGRTDGKNLSE